MAEQTASNEAQAPKKERFEFILTINDHIVCQRYFRIYGYRKESRNSIELLDTVRECVELIQNELKSKSEVYLHITSPQVFKDEEEAKAHLSRYNLEVPKFTIFKNRPDETYVWNGESFEEYTRFFRNDYAVNLKEEPQQILKFSFLDGGRQVISIMFDGSCYPKFVRTNIDLSNTRNRYRGGETYAPFEANVIDALNNGREDIIPLIVNKICACCSLNEEDEDGYYDTSDIYGDVEYSFDRMSRRRVYRKIEKSVKKKTNDYHKRG